MRYLIFIITAVLLCGCSSNWHLKRAIKKNPAIIRDAVVVTHYDTVTVVTEGARADTVFKYKPAARDTFVLETTKFRTQVIHDTVYKEMQIDTECFPDTIETIIEVPVTVYDIDYKDMKWYERIFVKFGKWAVILLLILVIISVLRFTLKKYLKGPLG